ncbi:hypothetical protein MMAN_46240 [Mycobacterium mantenii]|uniref:Uncharacterized protein n=1 Tax=Mycobacterium mantenii TaxID=560555 RepID=A0ABM7JY34_MYCNT|nr:hypothetical protein MMAN_46240 [Mycobacterium mantenii]
MPATITTQAAAVYSRGGFTRCGGGGGGAATGAAGVASVVGSTRGSGVSLMSCHTAPHFWSPTDLGDKIVVNRDAAVRGR